MLARTATRKTARPMHVTHERHWIRARLWSLEYVAFSPPTIYGFPAVYNRHTDQDPSRIDRDNISQAGK